jgi:hypothetical protein
VVGNATVIVAACCIVCLTFGGAWVRKTEISKHLNCCLYIGDERGGGGFVVPANTVRVVTLFSIVPGIILAASSYSTTL